MSAYDAQDESRLNNHPSWTTPILTNQISISLRPVKFGGQADVFRGQWYSDVQFEPLDVAVKVLRVANPPPDKVVRRLHREISLWQQLKHSNVHSLLGIHINMELSALPAMVSQWQVNGDINNYLKPYRNEPYVEVVKVQLLTQVIAGLMYLHKNNIIHGDIKGGNVLIARDGVAKLSDFGLSQVMTADPASFSQSTVVKGTCRWMAPELFVGDTTRHTILSDIWACGCLLIEVQCGIVPYATKQTDRQVIIALYEQELPPRPPLMPDLLWSLVLQCCNLQPQLRMPLNEILESLQMQHMISAGSMNVAEHVTADLGVQALLASLMRCVESQAYPTYSALEACKFLTHQRATLSHVGTSSDNLPMDGLLCDLLAIYIRRIVDSEDPSRLLQTTGMCTVRDLLAAVPQDECSMPMTTRYRPVQLRPLARALAVTDVKHASTVMRLFSSPLGSVIHTLEPCSVAWLPTGNQIVSSSDMQVHDADLAVVQLWDVATGQPVMDMRGHTDIITCVAVSPVGNRIASSSLDGSLRIWDAISGASVGEPFRGHEGGVFSVSFSPDGTRIVSGSDDRTLRIWSVETGRTLVGPMRGHTSIVRSVAFSPNGASVVSGSHDHTIRVWDAQTGICVLEPLEGHTKSVTSVTFSPDGHRIVSGSEDNSIRIWDATTGQTVIGPWRGHEDWVRSVAWSPDGTRIASASDDTAVCIWNAETGMLVAAPMRGHTDWVRSVAFSHDGRRVASSSENGTIRVWDATGDWMRWDI